MAITANCTIFPIMKRLLPYLLPLTMLACNPPASETANNEVTDEPSVEIEATYPELLEKALEAHGGLDQWRNYHTLRFDLARAESEVSERHIIDLTNRMVRIDGDNFTIGMDGQQVWSTPDIASTGKESPRFYHNLFFYFYAIPFVLADPGVNYEELGEVMVDSVTYNALKVSYNEGVGDADDDQYIAHFNTETNRLEMLLYTVTYYTGEKHDNYNALLYKDYQEVGGLLMPQNLQGYRYQGDSLAELRYNVLFKNVKFAEGSPEYSLFQMPKGAEIDSLN